MTARETTGTDPSARPFQWGSATAQLFAARSWSGGSVCDFRRPAAEMNWVSNQHRISLQLTPLRGASIQVRGGRTREFAALAPLSFTPAGVAIRTVMNAGAVVAVMQGAHTYDDLAAEMTVAGLLAAPALTYLIVHTSWHAAFAFLGLLSFLWAGVWFVFGRESPAPPEIRHYADRQIERISYTRLLSTPTTIATIICGYVAYSGLSLLLVWFTPYLSQALGYSTEEAGWLSALPPAGMIVVMTAAGWLSERAVLGGMATRRARGLLAAVGVMLGGIALCLIPFCPSSGLKVAMMVLGVALPSAIYVFAHPIVSEFTPPAQRAAVLSITNAGITLAGIAAPYTMGRLIEGSSSLAAGYERGFLACGAVTVIGGLIGAYFLRPQSELLRLSRGAAAR